MKARIVLRRSDGVLIGTPDISSFSCSVAQNSATDCTLVMSGIDSELISADTIIEYQRDPSESGQFRIDSENVFLSHTVDEPEYGDTFTVNGSRAIKILDRRVVPFFAVANDNIAQNYYTRKVMPADDMMKQIVRENFTSTMNSIAVADIPGSISGVGISNRIMATVLVDPDTSLCPTVSSSFANQKVLSVIQSIANLSAAAGTNLYFDMIYDSKLASFTFTTWPTLRGSDRRYSSFVLSSANGSLDPSTVKRRTSYANEVTWVHVGGSGQAKLRISAPAVSGTDSFKRSPFYPREEFIDKSGFSSSSDLVGAGSALINARSKQIKTINASALQIPGAYLGINYKLGDVVNVSFRGSVFPCTIEKYEISFNGETEKISVPLQSYDLEDN